MNTRRSSPSAPRFATTCALLLLAHSAQAAAYDWTAASGATWATGWTGGNVPTTSDDLTVLGPLNTAGVLNIDVAGTAAAKTINFTDPSAVTLTNVFSGADKTLTIQSGLTTGAGAVTIGSATANQGVLVALGASQTWNIGSGGLTINNTISGASFGITKSGTGTLTLNGANTYGGTTVINAGTLIANGDTAGVLASGKAFTLAGGTFNYTSSNGSAN
ncbi:MAG TPA: autotransporter-associated beta strand repeat-containing protein, partial [Roseimicrobium sp.]|nr:autotransporter-associated beta strand repeat-containing protein [Roseimicrobium sp.]